MSKYVYGGLYGPSKTGKTLAMVRALPHALYVAPRGALNCANWLDYSPKVVEAGEKVGIAEITKIIKTHSSKYPAIVVDDFSILADAELAKCKRAVAGWGAFDNFNKRVYDFSDAARNADCHVFVTTHEQAPKEIGQTGQKRWVKGCPLVPGWQLPEKLPAMWDIAARVVYDDSVAGWPYVLQTGPDPDYITGDRLAITPETFPMNLREVLLAAGYDVSRPEELAFFDEHVEAISHDLSSALAGKQGDVKKVFSAHQEPLLEAVNGNPKHVRWIFLDALDRASLRKHSSNLLHNFIDSM
jgi:hypothetical protein